MSKDGEKIPDPKEIEKELSEFLSKKFGSNVKIVSPMVVPQENPRGKDEAKPSRKRKVNFDLKPEELIAHLDQYIVKQDAAKAILATKICTHFNRIKRAEQSSEDFQHMVGSIKNNVLMIGPTGVGKTYIVKLIADKLGVPFVKGDATKFSETGYVGGDVEDLVRDLVREADDDIELAECGIIYLDEIDKIASSRNLIGADVSRTGVQRGLLKPLEETEVELKVPHDPISMIQEIERYRKTGQRERRTVNTRNILFIMSGAFVDLAEIVKKRIQDQGIGFGAKIASPKDKYDILAHIQSEDLIEYGFESEFVGRLPVRAVFERLEEEDLFEILKNPNNPIILGKKLDFDAYDIAIRFEDEALRRLAHNAYQENTGARGLVSAVERALMLFEKRLPSTGVRRLAVTAAVVDEAPKALERLLARNGEGRNDAEFDRLARHEKQCIQDYIESNRKNLEQKYSITLTDARIAVIAEVYASKIMDIGRAIERIKRYRDEIKKIELHFYQKHDINIVLEDDAMDFLIEEVVSADGTSKDFFDQLTQSLEYGLKLVRDKTGRARFFITREALQDPDAFVSHLIKQKEPPQIAAATRPEPVREKPGT